MHPYLRNCLIASSAVAFSGVSNVTRAQATVPGAAHDAPTRVLQIESVSGNVSLQRDSKSIAMQAGFLIFGEESLQLGDDASASLRLGRYGRLDLVPLDGSAALVSEKLPFSSWATDLSTELRVDGGALHVVWRRPAHADRWPLTISVGPWRSDLGAGEFLFRGDSKRASVCNVSGTMEVRYEGKGFRQSLSPGQCFNLRNDDSPERVALVASHWNSLWSNQLVRVSDGAPVVSLVQLSPAESRVRREAESLRPIDAPENTPTLDTRQEPVVAAPPAQGQSIASPVTSSPPAQQEVVVEESFRPQAETLEAPAVPESAVVEQTFVPVTAPAVPAQIPVVEVAPIEAQSENSSSAAPAPQRESLIYRAPERPVVAVPSSDFSAGPDGPEWIINVMTVTSQETAMEHIQRLNNAGYPATLRSETVRSRASYRVIVPGIGSEAGAQRVVGQLKKKMGYSAAWALQKR